MRRLDGTAMEWEEIVESLSAYMRDELALGDEDDDGATTFAEIAADWMELNQ